MDGRTMMCEQMLSTILFQHPSFSHRYILYVTSAEVSLPDGSEEWQKSCQKTAGGTGGQPRKCHPNMARLPNFHHANITVAKAAERVTRKRPLEFAIGATGKA